VTGPLQKRLRTICYTPALEKYWKENKKFLWNQADIDSLNRPAFSRVFLALPKADQRRISQLRCDMLPVNKRCSHWMKSRGSECPCCLQSCESVDHLLRCQSNLHHTNELYQSLQESMVAKKFHPTVISCILDNLARWLFPNDIAPERHAPLPECVQIALDAQASIGWNKFVRGFVAIQWIDASATLYDLEHDTPMETHMGAALVRPCLNYFLKRWIARNAALHGDTKETREQKQQALRDLRIDEYAEAAEYLLPRDRKTLLVHTAPQLKRLRPAQQRNWLAFAHTFLPTALQRREARKKTGQRHITDYFIEIYNPNGRPRPRVPTSSPGGGAATSDPTLVTPTTTLQLQTMPAPNTRIQTSANTNSNPNQTLSLTTASITPALMSSYRLTLTGWIPVSNMNSTRIVLTYQQHPRQQKKRNFNSRSETPDTPLGRTFDR
jgi:hypothetical protein